ncbi:MAG: CHAP domain-containing protein [Microbacterium sp.]|nr:CHAP domain-containing protein [Microbacterium sp.]
MISATEKSIGLGEPNLIQQWYWQRNGAAFAGNFAWCDAAVSYWATLAGERDAVLFGTDYAYTVAHASRFKAAGQWHAMSNGIKSGGIRRGDVVFFDWGGSSEIGEIDHVGIVTDVSADHKYVFTVESNSAKVCARRVRVVHGTAGFGRPKYKAAKPTTASSNSTASKRPQVSLAKFVKASKADPPKKGKPVSHAPTKYVDQALVAERLLYAQYADGHFGTGPGPVATQMEHPA